MSLLERVAAYFARESWQVARSEEGALELAVELEHGVFRCAVQTREDHGQVFFETVYPFRIPAGKRLVLCEFMARANQRLAASHFALDLDDGALTVRSSLAVTTDSDLTERLLDPLVYYNVTAANHFLPAVGAVCFADVAPRAALDAVTQIWTLEQAMLAANAALDDGE